MPVQTVLLLTFFLNDHMEVTDSRQLITQTDTTHTSPVSSYRRWKEKISDACFPNFSFTPLLVAKEGRRGLSKTKGELLLGLPGSLLLLLLVAQTDSRWRPDINWANLRQASSQAADQL